jgi:hypothetical protein
VRRGTGAALAALSRPPVSATCEVCGRLRITPVNDSSLDADACWRDYPHQGDSPSLCYRLGYAQQRARAEAFQKQAAVTVHEILSRAEAAEQRAADTEMLLQNASETVRREEARGNVLEAALQAYLTDHNEYGAGCSCAICLRARAALRGEEKP